MQQELGKFSGVRVVPSQANFIMVELTGRLTAKELTKQMLVKHKMFIKDLSGKIKGGQYIRIAVRNEEDNDMLLNALQEEFGL